MPTSMTTAPGLIQSRFTISGTPTAATSRSAPRQTAGRSLVLECATVTVQLSRSRSAAMGLPTMFERPMTTAFTPFRSRMTFLARMAEPVGVQGHERALADPQAADVGRVEAVDVPIGIDRVQNLLGIHVLRQRQLHQDAGDVLVRVEALHEGADVVLGGVGWQLVLQRLHRAAAACRAGARHRCGRARARRVRVFQTFRSMARAEGARAGSEGRCASG